MTATERFYQGIWRVLAEKFAVPRDPPELPAFEGETIDRYRPAPGFLRYLKFRFWIGLTAIDLAFLVAWIASFFYSIWLGVALTPAFIAIAILPDIIAYVAIHLQYDTTWYLLSSRSLRIRRGIWIIRETTITFENIQQVKLKQGPLQRHFGIADVEVTTAGGGGASTNGKGGHETTSHTGLLEGVADAERIRDLILTRVRRSRTAGLGDEDNRLENGWTADHLKLLREIRDELTTA